MKEDYKEVVVVIPVYKNKVLLQLRDWNEGIIYPGQWGFFGGSIEKGENPERAAYRELEEEIGYKPENMFKLNAMPLPDINNIFSHAFFCELKVPVEKLSLNEGEDLGLFSLAEIETNELYSAKQGKKFSVIPSGYIVNIIDMILKSSEALFKPVYAQ